MSDFDGRLDELDRNRMKRIRDEREEFRRRQSSPPAEPELEPEPELELELERLARWRRWAGA